MGASYCDCVQVVAIDIQAITLALTVCFVPALKQMTRHRPGPICTWPTFVLLGTMAFLAMLVNIVNMVILQQQPWFTGGTGLQDQVWSCVGTDRRDFYGVCVGIIVPVGIL